MPPWIRFSLPFVAITVLVASHWLAYKMGVRWTFDQINRFISVTEASNYEDHLRTSNSILQVAVRFPSDFSAGELSDLKANTEKNLKNVESISLPQAKSSGNLDIERRITKEINSARSLMAKLKGS